MEMGYPPVLLALRGSDNKTFSPTWPAAMEIYMKDRKCLHKKRVQVPQGYQRRRRFIVLEHQYGCRTVMVRLPRSKSGGRRFKSCSDYKDNIKCKLLITGSSCSVVT